MIEFVRKFLHFRKADYDKALRAAEARRKVRIYTYIYLHNMYIYTYTYIDTFICTCMLARATVVQGGEDPQDA